MDLGVRLRQKAAALLDDLFEEQEDEVTSGDIAQCLIDAGMLRDPSWGSLLSMLDEHWPEDIFPTLPDREDRDPGPRIVSLIRWVARLNELAHDQHGEPYRDRFRAQMVAASELIAERDRARDMAVALEQENGHLSRQVMDTAAGAPLAPGSPPAGRP